MVDQRDKNCYFISEKRVQAWTFWPVRYQDLCKIYYNYYYSVFAQESSA